MNLQILLLLIVSWNITFCEEYQKIYHSRLSHFCCFQQKGMLCGYYWKQCCKIGNCEHKWWGGQICPEESMINKCPDCKQQCDDNDYQWCSFQCCLNDGCTTQGCKPKTKVVQSICEVKQIPQKSNQQQKQSESEPSLSKNIVQKFNQKQNVKQKQNDLQDGEQGSKV